jgi:hypothetical protein
MKFLTVGSKMMKGLRLSFADEAEVREACPTGAGKLIINLIDTDTCRKVEGLKAIWTSNRIRLVDENIVIDPEVAYVVEVVSIEPRRKGERV